MAKSRDSNKSRKGAVRDPYLEPDDEFEGDDDQPQEEDDFVKKVNSSWSWLKQNLGWLAVALFILIIGFFRFYSSLTGVSIVAILFMARFLIRSMGRKGAWEWYKQRWKRVTLLVLIVPAVIYPILRLYEGSLTMDWESTMNPPKVYYAWLVDESGFSKEDQKRLDTLNPGKEKSANVRSIILLAAKTVDIHANEVVLYGSSVPQKGEMFSVVIFESYREPVKKSVEASEDQAGKPGADEPPKTRTVYVSHLRVSVLTPNFDAARKKKDESPSDKKEASFKIASYVVPESLDLSVESLSKTFSEASGRPVSFEGFQLYMRKRELEHRQQQGEGRDGVQLEGPG